MHHVEEYINDHVAVESQESCTEDLLALRVDEYLEKPLISPDSRARPTRVIVRLPTSTTHPDTRAALSVIPTRPSGGSMNSP